MLQSSRFKRIYIACGYTDLRYGIDGLAATVRERFYLNPFETDILFLFCGRRNDRIKALVWEGDGFLLLYKRLMMDKTPIQVLHEPGKTPESKSYVWLMRSGNDGLPPIIYYRYAPSRSGEVALELTDGIQPGTYLMCDGFSGYNKLKDVRRCTCYAHIRR